MQRRPLAVLGAITLVAALWLAATNLAFAQGSTPPPQPPGSNTSPGNLVLDPPPTSLPGFFHDFGKSVVPLWNIVVAASGVVFLVLLLVGGVQYLTSAGNDEQSKKAKTLLTEAVIGMVLVVIAWPVGLYVLKLLGVADTAIQGETNITEDPLTVDKTGGISSNAQNDPASGQTSGIETRVVKIELSNGSPGVQVIYRPVDAFARSGKAADILVVTDSQGIATWTNRPVGEKYQVIDKVRDKTIFEGTVNKDESDNDQLVPGDKTADDLVRVRMSATHQTTTKQLRNYTFALRNTKTGWISYISTANDIDAPYAEPLLEPGVTYEIIGGDGDIGQYQNKSFTVPTGPTGTENPAANWTVFVRPAADFTEELPSDIEDFQDDPTDSGAPTGTAT